MPYWNFQQPISVFVFLGFVLMAHVFLPWKGIDEWGPFFNWSLFSKNSNHTTFYDLQVEGANGLELYSSSPLRETETWNILQRFASQMSNADSVIDRDFLFSHLQKQKLRPIKIYKIKLPHQKYILLNAKEKSKNVEEIFKF